MDGTALTVTAVSVGNPHCVIFIERLERGAVRRLGPLIEHHPAFPNRINVQFARVAIALRGGHPDLGARRRLHAGLGLVVERGGVRRGASNGLCDHGLVTVRMPGGS